MREYHQKDNKYCQVLDIPPDRSAVAVLDGQQRLTALNIGLRGSYASRVRYGRQNSPASFPRKQLFVNSIAEAPENELGMKYDFKLMVPPKAQSIDDSQYWFPVYKLFEINHIGELMAEIGQHGLGNIPFAAGLIGALYDAIHSKDSLYFYEETDQSIDKVLDIFIRVNSGGTKLSHSDLLLSVATAQWSERDAREEIQNLLSAINSPDSGSDFAFTKDIVLKAGLMLTGVSDIGFKVRNFNNAHMTVLEQQWDHISRSLRVAANLLADFGLSSSNLTANSVILPVAYYIHSRSLGDDYRADPSASADRIEVKTWVIRSLLKSGIWGSGLDTLLGALRDVIDKHGRDGFPRIELEKRMLARGKSLAFGTDEIDELLESSYGWPETFAILTLLFPHVNTRNLHHVDHVLPRSMLVPNKVRAVLKDSDQSDWAIFYRDRVPNLQLLEGPENISKSSKLPLQWAQKRFTGHEYQHYLDANLLPGLPASVQDFASWCDQRVALIRDRLIDLLGSDPGNSV